MLKKFKIKKAGALMLSIMMLGTSVPAIAAAETAEPQMAQAAADTSFDAETVMWTNRTIEEVLAQTGKYKTVQEVDPNASNKNSSGVQSPYGNANKDTLTEWAYSEFVWTNYYPIGNGRMAGMVAGGIDNEVIQINEDTCWDGSPYGTLKDESGNTISTMDAAGKAKKIVTVNQTSGSVKDNWKYFRGANADGTPAEIGSSDAVVGDEAFRTAYPDFANKSISSQSLVVDNSKTNAAVQQRYSLESLVESKFLGNPTGQRAYKSFAEVYLNFGHKSAEATNYVKSLDMTKGIVTVEYDFGGAHYKRESFASYPDQTVVTHVESDKDLSFDATLHTNHTEKDGYYSYEKISDNEVKLRASVTNGGKDNNLGRINVINFEARMLLRGDGVFSVSDDNMTVTVNGGKTADIYVVGATNYVDYLTLDNDKPANDCQYYMDNVKSKTYDKIKERHLADFTPQFEKTKLNLVNSNGKDYSNTPTEKRVRKDVSGKSGFTLGAGSKLNANSSVKTTYSEGDNQLAALEFNYGKYLILSGSRDGRSASGDGEINIPESQPLNLTGKWNAAMSAGWNGKYTININTEMNYWAAQPLGIGESERPLIDTFDELAQSGSITADYQYGIGDSSSYQPGDPWVMHHNFDLWRGTQPIDNATAGLWPTGGAWLLDHAWQYYQFNKDNEYLAEIYPYMIGAAKFFTQFLVVDPKTGYLITAASCSPEQGGVQPGPAMDTQLVRNLYDMVQQSSKILGKETENADLLAKIAEQMPSNYLADEKDKVAPNLIDGSGLIKEWVRGDVQFDFSENSDPEKNKYKNIENPFTGEKVSINEHTANNNNGHRHCSHLWEMFPGTHLSGYSDDANEQKIFKAYQKSVSARGSGSGQGWGLAWRINLNARALDGNTASKMLEQLFQTRTSPNLFDQHPNFQIDGNYGAASGIIEMLIQSHDGAITLLPAIPDTWASGSFEGFNTREGASVDLSWNGGKPETAKLHVTESGDKNIRSKYVSEAKVYDESGKEVETTLNDDRTLLTFGAEAGKTYTINNFGTNVTEGNRVYKASEVTEFYASDKGTVPKLDSNGVEIGYIYNRENAKIGYAVNDFDFEGLRGITLNMAKVRKSDTYVSVTVDKPNGTEIANQLISTGDNELTLKNIDGINGTHKIYVLYYRNPYVNDDKYIGNAGNITALYDKSSPTPASCYSIESASYDANANLNIDITYTGSGSAPSAQLIIATYDENGVLMATDTSKTINGTGKVMLNYAAPDKGTVKAFIWDSLESMQPLSEAKTADLTQPTNPPEQPTNPPEQPTNPPAPAVTGAYIGDTKYDTVGAAVAAAEAMNPTSEETRITIDLMPGTYREQITVNKPYITIQKKPGTEGEAKITWYYGQGSLYDSCNSSGFYDPSVIGDGESYPVKNWGAALNINKSATAFTAKDIYLENSYNAYYIEEELNDITGPDPDTNNSCFKRVDFINDQKAAGKSDEEINKVLRGRVAQDIKYTTKDKAESPRERCAALYCSADKAQFTGCTVMSTQDTIGINSGRMYFKDCKLGGTTDFICGSATAVFDGCELYANAGEGGDSATITAPSNPIESDGYLFYNCRITGTSLSERGNLGRPWSGVNASANYINTVIGSVGGKLLIGDSGWTDMGCKPEEARFNEYNSTKEDGSAVDVSKRRGNILDEWKMLRYNPLIFTMGTDNWDPAGLADKYAKVNEVVSNTTIDTSNGAINEITLPAAPNGYEFKWESNSEFATVSSDGTKLSLIRPANGEQPIEASVRLYVRESGDKTVGAEKSIDFEIQPTSDTANVFTVSGTVSLSTASAEAQTVKIEFKKGEAVVKTVNVVIDANTTSKAYTAENIPIGTYMAVASTENADYNITTASVEITGAKGETKTFDVRANKMSNITVSSPDFAGVGFTPSITAADGFSAEKYTALGTETANLGAGNTVYKLTKEEGKTVAAKTGVSFDLKSMLPSGSTLKNTKTLTFGYDFLMEKTAYYPTEYSYFDLATSKSNAGANKEDQTRFVRWGVHQGWGQFNMFTAKNERVNGDKTQFDKNNTMANRWYRIVANIDLENNTITTTLYDRDKNMEMLNGKPFNIAVPDADGNNPQYPTSINLDNLYFNVYMDKNANTKNKMEYYIDNITLEYQDFE